MPKIEITITEDEAGRLHKKLEDLYHAETSQKQNIITNTHHYVKQLVHEAYELGKEVGNAGLD